jgi:UDP-glucose:(heptosyl)LPS alpha-1,3-glucosyltransferase
MRIGIVLKTFKMERGGAEVWTLGFVRWLVQQGHEVHVVARKCDDVVHTLGVTMHIVNIRSPWRFAAAVERLLRSLDLDIAHDMGFGWYWDIFHSHVGSPIIHRRWLRKIKSGPRQFVALLAAALLPSYYRKRALYRRQFSGHPNVVYLALSHKVARDYQRIHRISSESIRVIHNGVDINKFTPAQDGLARDAVRRSFKIGKDEIVLMLLANEPRLKGLPMLVRVANQLVGQGHGIHVWIVGGGPRKDQLAQIGRLGLGDRIHFVGRVEDPVPYFQSADIYVHLTRYDACSLAVLEALASGLPVITTSCNGASELIEDGVCGYVLDEGASVDEICARIRHLLPKATRQSVGIRAREAADHLSLDENYRRIIDVYHEALARKRPGSRRHSHRLPPLELPAA